MPVGTEVGLGPGHNVLDGDPAPPKKGHSPHLSAHVCGQTAGWIKMPLGTKVGLGSGHIVLHGDPDPQKGGTAPNFRPMSIVAKRMMLYNAPHKCIRPLMALRGHVYTEQRYDATLVFVKVCFHT